MASLLLIPSFVIVLLIVTQLWHAYLRTLSESELHLRIFDHSTAVSLAIWSVVLALTCGASWWVAGRLVRRR